MTKRLLFSTSFILCIILSYAQPQISLIGGIHKSKITPSFLKYPDTSISKIETASSGIEVGFAADIPITGKLYFRPGVIYSVLGSNWNQIYDTINLVNNTKKIKNAEDRIKPYSLNTKLQLAYINMPLDIMFKTNIGAKTKVLIAAGPQLSFLFNGYKELNKINVSQDSAQKVKTYFTNEKNTDLPIGKLPEQYRTVHFGANALAGIEFGRIYFTMNYSKDLTKFYEEDNRDYKASTLGACIGIYFGQRQGKNQSSDKSTKN